MAAPTLSDSRLRKITKQVVREVLHELRDGKGMIAPAYFTPAQAAAYTGVAVKTLELYRATGVGPRYFKMGNGPRARVRYRPEDLRAFVEARGAEE